jgi:endonuclease/exonuclease/phosphatase family metal-dependent hydrolase
MNDFIKAKNGLQAAIAPYKFTCICLLFALVTASFSGLQAQNYLNVMTFNIRLNTPRDSANAWSFRKDIAASQVLFQEVHILGVQEALPEQMDDLQTSLKKYRYVGGGREDGKRKGEFSAIFYDTTRLQLLQTKTFWLSETPDVPGSKSWDAAITRIITWAKFKDRVTGKIFFHFNTHFDHIGKVARRESAKIMLETVHKVAGKTVSVITGDFNSSPIDEPIQIITDSTNPLYLIDTKKVSVTPHFGPNGTFNSSFQAKESTDQPIDYIFLKNGGKVLQHATLANSWGGRASSDHFPVFARIKL